MHIFINLAYVIDSAERFYHSISVFHNSRILNEDQFLGYVWLVFGHGANNGHELH